MRLTQSKNKSNQSKSKNDLVTKVKQKKSSDTDNEIEILQNLMYLKGNIKISNDLKYENILNVNKIKKEEFYNFISKNNINNNELKTEYSQSDKNYNTPKSKQKKIKTYFFLENENNLTKNVETILDYNNNLQKIQMIKEQNLKLFYNQKKFQIIDQTRNKWNTQKYYSHLLNYISSNVQKKKKSGNKQLLKNVYTRYMKTKEDFIYLEKYFKKHNYKWNSAIIKKLSKKLFLPKYNIYRWNWDKLNNRLRKNHWID